MVKDFCFSTLAVGKRYRNHARILAPDIQEHVPNASLVVLTDKPSDFIEYNNVIPIKHHLQSVKGYDDKRFVLEKSLTLFESCMFLDSDVRVLSPIIREMKWFPGITARAGGKLVKHMENAKNKKEIELVKIAAHQHLVDLEKIEWFHEFMFVMKKQNGWEASFFQLWETLSYLFEMQGIYHGEGLVMGIAAAKVGMTIDFFAKINFHFLKIILKKKESEIENQVFGRIKFTLTFIMRLSFLSDRSRKNR